MEKKMGIIDDAMAGVNPPKETKPSPSIREDVSNKTHLKSDISELTKAADEQLAKQKKETPVEQEHNPSSGLPVTIDNNEPSHEDVLREILEASSLEVTEEEKSKMLARLAKTDYAIDSIVKLCNGSDCPHYWCPFKAIHKYPNGKICPIERKIAEQWYVEYANVLDIAPGDVKLIQMQQILTLIECELTDLRMKSRIQREGETRLVNAFGLRNGEVVENEEISLAFDIKDKVNKRKDTILKQMLAYPEIRAKYKMADKNTGMTDSRIIIAKAEEILGKTDDKTKDNNE